MSSADGNGFETVDCDTIDDDGETDKCTAKFLELFQKGV